jgi:hypothetical protein
MSWFFPVFIVGLHTHDKELTDDDSVRNFAKIKTAMGAGAVQQRALGGLVQCESKMGERWGGETHEYPLRTRTRKSRWLLRTGTSEIT